MQQITGAVVGLNIDAQRVLHNQIYGVTPPPLPRPSVTTLYIYI